VWLSEIILQQTRVDQGLPYWESFIETFPTVMSLAKAKEEQVLRLWQGLGYYSRARNLHQTANHIYSDLGGKFPSTYDEIIKLKGVGPYTAAAIASICFDEPRPVVDGNVFRFASRYFGIKTDISSSSARKEFEKVLTKYIDKNQPGIFNQAMMEFGATVCAPSANCPQCPFQKSCYAYAHSGQKMLPVKTKKIKVRDRHFNYIVFRQQDSLLLKSRNEKDVWTGLYDFYLIEGEMREEEVLSTLKEQMGNLSFFVRNISGQYKHILSHQKIKAVFYELELEKESFNSVIQKSNLSAFSPEEILNLPKPKLIVNYLNQSEII